jgi:hypothetical protein
LAIFGLLALAAYLSATPTGGWDIWWHLKTGQLAIEQHTTLPTDPFSFSFGGQPWGHKDLLADVLLYLGFAGFGFGWLALLKGLVVAAIGASVFLLGRRARAPALGSALVAGLAIVAVQYRLVERPVLFSLALLPLLVLLLERLRLTSSAERAAGVVRALVPVVALLWLWSWLHREALIGIGLFGLEVGGYLLARRLGTRGHGAPSTRFLLAVTIGFVAALILPLASPGGVHFYSTGLSVARSEEMRAVISDWDRIGPLQLIRDFPVTVLLLLAAVPCCVRRIARLGRRGDTVAGARLAHVIGLALFAVAAVVDSVRWIPYVSTLAALVAVHGLGDPGSFPGSLVARAARLRGATALAIVVCLGASFLLNNRGTGIGPMPGRYPDGAVEFAREQGLEGRVANAFYLGGYLIWKMWPETRVLIDGRNDLVYPPEFLLETIGSQRHEPAFRRQRDADGATWVLAGNLPGQLTHSFLARSADWMLVYWSEPAVIYARRDAHAELARHELHHVDPVAVDVSIVRATQASLRAPDRLEAIGEEVRRMLRASPDGLRANTAAALYFHFRGPELHGRRDQVLDRLGQLFPGHPAVVDLRQRLSES